MTDYAHAEHEARHVVACWFVNAPVESAAVGAHAPQEGIVKTPPMENGAANLLTRLVGWLGDEDLPRNAAWPPAWPPPVKHDVDGLSWCVRFYGLSKETYATVVEIALELVNDPEFERAVTLVARGLMAAPRIDAEGLEVLRAATAFAEPEPIGAPA